ncbi:MAG: hypothetical protein GX197_08695 [Firmicutes bacterium]|nr:hypothetical protein [Bacillota bacterium]
MIKTSFLERIAKANKCEFQGDRRLTPSKLYKHSQELLSKYRKYCEHCQITAPEDALPANISAYCEFNPDSAYDPTCFLA